MKKLISISLVIVLVGASLFFYIKNKPMEYVNMNQLNTLESFQKFFTELHARGLADDMDFIGKTIPVEITDKIQELRGTNRDQYIRNRILSLKDSDMSSVKYGTTDSGFSVYAITEKEKGYTQSYTVTYKNVGGVWIEYNDYLFPTPEQLEEQKNKNQYALTLFGHGNADFKVTLNDKEVKEFAMSDPTKGGGKALNDVLHVKPGKNTLVIEIIPRINSEEVAYSYHIYESPKELNMDDGVISQEKHTLFNSELKDKKAYFMYTTKTEKLSFEINAT